MKGFFSLTALVFCIAGKAQFYYNDIIATNISNHHYSLIKLNKIKKVQVITYDANNQPEDNFSLEQEFSNNWGKMSTTSTTATGATSVIVNRYENDKVQQSTEIGKGVETVTKYTYDDKGRTQSISSTTKDTSLQYQSSEVHEWLYNDANQPSLMLKIKNNSDTTRIEFIYDEKGNVAEEHWKRKGVEQETYYYYYNNGGFITDIVRFNKRVQKLLPDFLFEYDNGNKLTQQTQVPAGSSNYVVWKYDYNEMGLKQTETCYSKTNEMIGKVVYNYIK
ncbi:MAG: hypothetical protein KGO81_08160 [Bacteroidota bacterium]|nr:hypothetical protein [Bacteroidota bacterium]